MSSWLIGDKVFVQVKGCWRWPAIITDIVGNKYRCTFYQTDQTAEVVHGNIFSMRSIPKTKLKKYTKTNRQYTTALEQMAEAIHKDGADAEFLNLANANDEENVEGSNDDDETTKNKTVSLDMNEMLERILAEQMDESDFFIKLKDSEQRKYVIFFKEDIVNNLAIVTKAVKKYMRCRHNDPEPLLFGRSYHGSFFGVYICRNVSDVYMAVQKQHLEERCQIMHDISDARTPNKEHENEALYRDAFWHDLTKLQQYLVTRYAIREDEKRLWSFLDVEFKFSSYEIDIKKNLGMSQTDSVRALESLQKIYELDLQRLMLVKHPHLVHTIKRLRSYVGNLSQENVEEFEKKAADIRQLADKVYIKIKRAFGLEADQRFSEFFFKEMDKFKEKVTLENLSETDIIKLHAEPGTKEFIWARKSQELKCQLGKRGREAIRRNRE